MLRTQQEGVDLRWHLGEEEADIICHGFQKDEGGESYAWSEKISCRCKRKNRRQRNAFPSQGKPLAGGHNRKRGSLLLTRPDRAGPGSADTVNQRRRLRQE